jgi:hypothetical protein
MLLSLGGTRLNREDAMAGQAPVDFGRDLHAEDLGEALE